VADLPRWPEPARSKDEAAWRLGRYREAVLNENNERGTGAEDNVVAYAVELIDDWHRCALEAAHRVNRETGRYVKFPEYPQADREKLEAELRELPPGWAETRAALIAVEEHDERVRREREESELEAVATEEPGPVSSVDRGGRPLKTHPELALREAARMFVTGAPTTNEVAKDVTAKVVKRLTADELEDHRWTRFAWEDADAMRRAIEDRPRFARWTPDRGLEVRTKPRGRFRKVGELEWLPIPQPR